MDRKSWLDATSSKGGGFNWRVVTLARANKRDCLQGGYVLTGVKQVGVCGNQSRQ